MKTRPRLTVATAILVSAVAIGPAASGPFIAEFERKRDACAASYPDQGTTRASPWCVCLRKAKEEVRVVTGRSTPP